MHSYRMKLSCLRCKDRKLRCDRGEPQCKRCQNSSVQCLYPDKRKTRGARQKSDIHRLDHRLEALEEQLKAATTKNVSQESPNRTHSPTETTRVETPHVNLENAPKDDAFLYRMVSGAKHSIEALTTQSSEPSSPWNQSTVNSAITRLDTALVQLAAPFPRPDSRPPNDPKINIPKCDLKQYINTFLDYILPHATVFDSFTTLVDPEFLRALPHIIDSPYAHVTPVMRVVYYCAICLGQSVGTDEQQRLATKTYYACLQSVPRWVESAEGTQLDILAGAFTTWLAINNFDYHLAWQFHCETCRLANRLGIHDVETAPLSTPQEEADKEVKRRLHWYLVEMDFLFRLLYDKPKALQCSPTQVKLPAVISPATKQPKPYESILFIVWSRALHIVADFFNDHETLPEDTLSNKVDEYCNQLTELLDDWDLLSVARAPKVGTVQSWLYAESAIAFHSFIIYMRRKISATVMSTHPQAVCAARAIISIIHEWSGRNIGPAGDPQCSYIHLITFYPFCAFFTLYYHILSSTDPSEREEDIRSLEKVVTLMTKAASVRPDFVPIASAMSALNDVSRAVHSGYNPPGGLTLFGGAVPPRHFMESNASPSHNATQLHAGSTTAAAPFDSLQKLSVEFPLQPVDELHNTFGVPFQLESQIAFDWDPASSSRPSTARTVSQPVDIVRAIEGELTWRDWHESWWNIPDASQANQAGKQLG
ncbi:hypothetical protein BDW72DRAFT_198349 [Aspergillus terricola var. indicus]